MAFELPPLLPCHPTFPRQHRCEACIHVPAAVHMSGLSDPKYNSIKMPAKLLICEIVNICLCQVVFFFLIEIKLIYNVMLFSGVQQSDSLMYLYTSILFQILFHYSLLQDIE